MKYSDEDKALLKSSIQHNEIVSDVVALFTNPMRTEDAIVRQAQTLGFGVKTTDGIKRFVEGKGTRVSNNAEVVSEEVETLDEVGETEVIDSNLTPTSTEGTTKYRSDKIVADKGLEANNIAIRMLQNENLSINAEVVYKLSLCIEEVLV